MPRPFASPVVLTPELRTRLQGLLRAGSTPQALAFRCRLILRAADPEQPSNLQIANELGCDRHTVGQWRERFVTQGLGGLQDAPRSGRPRNFSPLATSGCR
jgi:Winged helix-turn helix